MMNSHDCSFLSVSLSRSLFHSIVLVSIHQSIHVFCLVRICIKTNRCPVIFIFEYVCWKCVSFLHSGSSIQIIIYIYVLKCHVMHSLSHIIIIYIYL
jgi:hypothetical protein